MTTTTAALATQSPAEIDGQLSEIYQRKAKAQQRLWYAQDYLARIQQGSRVSDLAYAHYLDQVEKSQAAIEQANAEMAPLQEEFSRRGGWTRCFLVTNTNGHVHRSMSCSTCYPRTQYHWMTEWSAKPYEQIIEDAGSRACTVCYPDAPVDKPSVMFTPEERADQERREQERQAREAKKAAKAAKAITAPDGRPLRGRWGVIATERTAQIEAVDALLEAKAWSEFHPKADWHQQSPEEWAERCAANAAEYAAEAAKLIEALAAKRGQSAEQVRAELQKKADAKYRKEGYG
jgi:hypothetical protein